MNSNVRHLNRRGIIFSAATDFSFLFAKDYSIEKMEKKFTHILKKRNQNPQPNHQTILSKFIYYTF